MFQDSVPAGSYNDPFLSSVCVCFLLTLLFDCKVRASHRLMPVPSVLESVWLKPNCQALCALLDLCTAGISIVEKENVSGKIESLSLLRAGWRSFIGRQQRSGLPQQCQYLGSQVSWW